MADAAAPPWMASARRFGAGIGLSALYGLALGARAGGAELAHDALRVPLALLGVTALGVPALYIVLLLCDAPIRAEHIASAAARGAVASGRVLGGLAPAALLYVVTATSTEVAVLTAAAGLAVGGLVGLSAFVREVSLGLSRAPMATRAASRLALLGFALFATALTARVWIELLLRVAGGAS